MRSSKKLSSAGRKTHLGKLYPFLSNYRPIYTHNTPSFLETHKMDGKRAHPPNSPLLLAYCSYCGDERSPLLWKKRKLRKIVLTLLGLQANPRPRYGFVPGNPQNAYKKSAPSQFGYPFRLSLTSLGWKELCSVEKRRHHQKWYACFSNYRPIYTHNTVSFLKTSKMYRKRANPRNSPTLLAYRSHRGDESRFLFWKKEDITKTNTHVSRITDQSTPKIRFRSWKPIKCIAKERILQIRLLFSLIADFATFNGALGVNDTCGCASSSQFCSYTLFWNGCRPASTYFVELWRGHSLVCIPHPCATLAFELREEARDTRSTHCALSLTANLQ